MVSGYIPVVRFRNDVQEVIDNYYVSPLIKVFFSNRNIDSYYEVFQEESLSARDFSEVRFTYFYDVIMRDLYKLKNPKASAAYSTTYDIANVVETCTKTGLGYQVINLGNQPVFFLICLQLQDVLDFVKDHDFKPIPSKYS